MLKSLRESDFQLRQTQLEHTTTPNLRINPLNADGTVKIFHFHVVKVSSIIHVKVLWKINSWFCMDHPFCPKITWQSPLPRQNCVYREAGPQYTGCTSGWNMRNSAFMWQINCHQLCYPPCHLQLCNSQMSVVIRVVAASMHNWSITDLMFYFLLTTGNVIKNWLGEQYQQLSGWKTASCLQIVSHITG